MNRVKPNLGPSIYRLKGHLVLVKKVVYPLELMSSTIAHFQLLERRKEILYHALDIIQSGIRIGYQIHIEELVVSLNLGVYILDSYRGDGFMYHRVSTRYYFTKHWGANLSLKTHFFKADFIELGAAYRF